MSDYTDLAKEYARLYVAHNEAEKEARAARTREENLGIELINQLKTLRGSVGRNTPRKTFKISEKHVLLVEWAGEEKLPNCFFMEIE